MIRAALLLTICLVLRAGSAIGQVVGGVVLDSTHGRPVAGVTASLLNGSTVLGVAITDESGRFSIRMVAIGEHTLNLRRVGLRPATLRIPVGAVGMGALSIRMVTLPLVLDTIVAAEARRTFLFSWVTPGAKQFIEHYNKYPKGLFFSGREIEASGLDIADFLARLPGFRFEKWEPFTKVRGLTLYDDHDHPTRILTAPPPYTCLTAQLDYSGNVIGLSPRELLYGPVNNEARRRMDLRTTRLTEPAIQLRYSWTLKLSEIRGIEVYLNSQDGPPEWTIRALDKRCAILQFWSYRAW